MSTTNNDNDNDNEEQIAGLIYSLTAATLAYESAIRIGDQVGRYQAAIRATHACAAILRALPLAEFSAAARTADAIGWVTDPTLYREKAAALRVDLDVLRAAIRFHEDVGATLARARSEHAPAWPPRCRGCLAILTDTHSPKRCEVCGTDRSEVVR